jgi:aminoglycoside phosphotransferase (APT) family kinase protein
MTELFGFYRQAGDQVVLTHGDLSGLNIMLEADEVVGIVDWETAA